MAGGLKRLAKDTAVYGLSSIIGRFLNWMMVPMYVRVLDNIGEFGVYTNMYAWVALLLIILTYGMETGLFRFINHKDEDNPDRVYATVLCSIGATSLMFIALVFTFLAPLSRVLNYEEHPEYLAMMVGVVGIDAFCCMPFAYLRHKRKAFRFMGIKLFSTIFLNIVLNIFFLIVCPYLHREASATVSWFYVPNYGVGYVFVANVITSVTTFLLLIPDMIPAFRSKVDFGLLKRMLKYSYPILILGVAGIFNQTADKILYPFLFDDEALAREQLGIYGACFKIAVVMAMFTNAFRYAYDPFVFAHNKNNSGDNNAAYSDSMKYFIIFSLVIFIGVMFYLDILKYFVSEDCYPGLGVVPIVMMGELFFGIYYNLSIWYKLSDRTIWGAYFSIAGCVITVGIILLFAPVYGYFACAWASFACNLMMLLLSYFTGQKKYPISYDLKSAFAYFTIAAALYVAGMYPEIESTALRLTYRTALLAVFAAYIIKKDFCILLRKH